LFYWVESINKEKAKKITEMFLELSEKECVDLVNDQKLLQKKSA
jgi:hypothetical protein